MSNYCHFFKPIKIDKHNDHLINMARPSPDDLDKVFNVCRLDDQEKQLFRASDASGTSIFRKFLEAIAPSSNNRKLSRIYVLPYRRTWNIGVADPIAETLECRICVNDNLNPIIVPLGTKITSPYGQPLHHPLCESRYSHAGFSYTAVHAGAFPTLAHRGASIPLNCIVRHTKTYRHIDHARSTGNTDGNCRHAIFLFMIDTTLLSIFHLAIGSGKRGSIFDCIPALQHEQRPTTFCQNPTESEMATPILLVSIRSVECHPLINAILSRFTLTLIRGLSLWRSIKFVNNKTVNALTSLTPAN